jgi:hypothetical protein
MNQSIEDINDLAAAALDAEHHREESFTAAPFHWKDIPLHPFAIDREADWLLHCQRIGLPASDVAIRSLDTFLSHAVRLIWFCAHEEPAWLANWMLRGGSLLLDLSIREWSRQHILPGDQIAVTKLALEIHDRAHVNHATRVDTDDAGELGEGHGPSDEHNTSRSSHPSPDRLSLPAGERLGLRPLRWRRARRHLRVAARPRP